MGRWAKIIQSFSIDIFNIQDIKLSFSGYGRERIVDVGKTHHDGLCQQAGCHQERHDGRWLAEVKNINYKKHQKMTVYCKMPYRSDPVTLCPSTMRTSMPSLAERRCERNIENSNLEHTHNFQIFTGLDHNCGRRKHSTSAHS